MVSFIERYRQTRKADTSLIAIESPDQIATIEKIGSENSGPIITWDCCNGWIGENEEGKRHTITLASQEKEADKADKIKAMTVSIVDCLTLAKDLPKKSVLIIQNSHIFFREDARDLGPLVVQSLYNLRELFKGSRRSVVLLGPQFNFPSELVGVVSIEEEFPSEGALEVMTRRLVAGNKKLIVSEEEIKIAAGCLRGLSLYGAEQELAISVDTVEKKLDLGMLRERARRAISRVPGCSIWGGSENFGDVGGHRSLVEFLGRVIRGKKEFNLVCQFDEVEKDFAGIGGDSSGVSQSMFGRVLSEIQDREIPCILLTGIAGSGKSLISKCLGGEIGCDTMCINFSSAKDSLVGKSEENVNSILKVIRGVSGGRAIFVMTCNKVDGLPPEFKRRMNLGTWFFDLPDLGERELIWGIYLRKFGLSGDEGWRELLGRELSGAEIRGCCELAWMLGCGVREAVEYIVPIVESSREEIERIRMMANGRFLSTRNRGSYSYISNNK